MDNVEKGFVQGVAWVLWVIAHHDGGPGQLLKESGLTLQQLREARVDDEDVRVIRRIAKLERYSLARRRVTTTEKKGE